MCGRGRSFLSPIDDLQREIGHRCPGLSLRSVTLLTAYLASVSYTALAKGETMLSNAFIGRSGAPSESELAKALGPAKATWDQLLIRLTERAGIDGREWKSYSTKAGWSLRLKQKKRAVVYLSPSQGCFMASFALGDKAVHAALNSTLPKRVMKIIAESRKYAEGTAVRIDVTKESDIETVARLAELKIQN